MDKITYDEVLQSQLNQVFQELDARGVRYNLYGTGELDIEEQGEMWTYNVETREAIEHLYNKYCTNKYSTEED